MKVAFVFMSMPVGGAEDFAISMGRHFPPEVEAHFVCLRSAGVLGEELAASGRCHVLPIATGKRFSLSGMRQLGEWLVEGKFDAVHSQTYHAHSYAVAAASRAGIPSVLHQQKTLEPMPWHRHWTMRYLCGRATHVVALSQKTSEDMQRVFKVPADRITVLPNAVDDAAFAPADRQKARQVCGLPGEVPIIGAVASLNTVKNHEATLEMFAALQKTRPESRCIIVGEGRERRALGKRTQELNTAATLQLVGNQRPVAPWMQSMDVLVHPSHWEGQPIAVLQAMACGIPVVASRIEGNIAALGASHPALFNPADAAEYLTLVQRVLSDSAFRTEVLAHQKQHSPPLASVVAAELAALYQRLLESQ